MHLLLLGKNGQLGWELQRTLAPLGEVIALDLPEIDLARPDSLREEIRNIQPHLIVNAAAYTAVDRAESEPEIAMAVNGRSPAILAEYASDTGASLIHYSTDYVFDGDLSRPYVETDQPNPLNIYGASKVAGEQAIQKVGGAYMILRTSWVYSLRGESFVTKVLRWSREQRELGIVADQVSNPTWARMLAETTAHLLAKAGPDVSGWLREYRGLYHLAGWGYASRLKWAQAILRYDPNPKEQVTTQIMPALTSDFPTPAQRPLFTALNCELFAATFGIRMPAWDNSLQMAMEGS